MLGHKNSWPKRWRAILGVAVLILLHTSGGRVEGYETCVNGSMIESCHAYSAETMVDRCSQDLPRLNLTRHDPHRLFPSGGGEMFREVEGIFHRVGVDVGMMSPDEVPVSSPGAIVIGVIVMPHGASDWGWGAMSWESF